MPVSDEMIEAWSDEAEQKGIRWSNFAGEDDIRSETVPVR